LTSAQPEGVCFKPALAAEADFGCGFAALWFWFSLWFCLAMHAAKIAPVKT